MCPHAWANHMGMFVPVMYCTSSSVRSTTCVRQEDHRRVFSWPVEGDAGRVLSGVGVWRYQPRHGEMHELFSPTGHDGAHPRADTRVSDCACAPPLLKLRPHTRYMVMLSLCPHPLSHEQVAFVCATLKCQRCAGGITSPVALSSASGAARSVHTVTLRTCKVAMVCAATHHVRSNSTELLHALDSYTVGWQCDDCAFRSTVNPELPRSRQRFHCTACTEDVCILCGYAAPPPLPPQQQQPPLPPPPPPPPHTHTHIHTHARAHTHTHTTIRDETPPRQSQPHWKHNNNHNDHHTPHRNHNHLCTAPIMLECVKAEASKGFE
jgi:hypothetical protein